MSRGKLAINTTCSIAQGPTDHTKRFGHRMAFHMHCDLSREEMSIGTQGGLTMTVFNVLWAFTPSLLFILGLMVASLQEASA